MSHLWHICANRFYHSFGWCEACGFGGTSVFWNPIPRQGSASRIPNVVGMVNTEAPLWFAEKYIPQNGHRYFTVKLMFNQKPKLIRSVASDGLVFTSDNLTKYHTKNSANYKFGRKMFPNWKCNWRSNSINLKIDKIFTVLRCISGPNLDILTLLLGEFSRGQLNVWL